MPESGKKVIKKEEVKNVEQDSLDQMLANLQK